MLKPPGADAANLSLEAYLTSGKAPNHFLHRARTQAIRTKKYGLNPEPMQWRKSEEKLDPVDDCEDEEGGSSRERRPSIGSDPGPETVAYALKSVSSDNLVGPLSKGIRGGFGVIQAVKNAPVVRSLLSDHNKVQAADGEDARHADAKDEATIDCEDGSTWRAVVPGSHGPDAHQSPILLTTDSLLTPGMVDDQEHLGVEPVNEVQASDDGLSISKQSASQGDHDSSNPKSEDYPSRHDSRTRTPETAKTGEQQNKRISQMVIGVRSNSRTQDLTNLVKRKVSEDGIQSSLLKKIVQKNWALQKMGHGANETESKGLFTWFRRTSITRASQRLRISGRLSQNTVLQASKISEWCRRSVDKAWFSTSACLAVLLHSLFLAIDTDFDLGSGASSISFVGDSLFTAVYIAELSIRILAHRRSFFRSSWNTFDFILVGLSVVDLIVVLATSSADPSLSVMASIRMIRLLRLVRLLRVFRFFKPLWLLVCGIAASMRTVLWAWLLIDLLIYIFGLIFTRVYSPYTCAADDVGGRVDPELNEYFGDVWRSMFSVFQCITLEDWIVLADVGARHEPWTRSLFMLILGICTWGVMHVITAVFVESALEASSVRSMDLAKKAKEEYNETCQKLCEVFWKADNDQDGSLSKSEFLHALADPAVSDKLRDLGIDRSFAATLFDILDLDGSATLERTEFIEGLLRSRGPAQNKDVIGMRCDVWRVQLSIQDELERACAFIEAKLQMTMERVKKLQKDAMPVLKLAAEQLARPPANAVEMSIEQVINSSQEADVTTSIGLTSTSASLLPLDETLGSIADVPAEVDLPLTEFDLPPAAAFAARPNRSDTTKTSGRGSRASNRGCPELSTHRPQSRNSRSEEPISPGTPARTSFVDFGQPAVQSVVTSSPAPRRPESRGSRSQTPCSR